MNSDYAAKKTARRGDPRRDQDHEEHAMNAAPPIEPADVDPLETREWLEALEAVIAREGPERAHFLLEELIALGHRAGINIPYSATTEYTNTIPHTYTDSESNKDAYPNAFTHTHTNSYNPNLYGLCWLFRNF